MLALLAVAFVWLLHPLVLRLLARPLQSADPDAPSEYFCLRGGEQGIDGFDAFDRAAQWHRTMAGQGRAGGTILLVLPRTSRIVEIGAVPSFEQTCRRELLNAGLLRLTLSRFPAIPTTPGTRLRALADWLARHPRATVSLACGPYTAGEQRYVFDKVLGPRDSRRVRLMCLPDPACPPDSWWKTRTGVKEFMFAWLELLYAWCHGDDAPAPQPSAAVFESEVRTTIGEAKVKYLQWLGCGLIAAGFIAILGLLLASPAVLSALGRWLDVGRPPQNADVVVLLNGSYNSRPFVAAALVRGRWATKVVLNTVALHPRTGRSHSTLA